MKCASTLASLLHSLNEDIIDFFFIDYISQLLANIMTKSSYCFCKCDENSGLTCLETMVCLECWGGIQEAEISYFHGECLFGVEHFLSLIFFWLLIKKFKLYQALFCFPSYFVFPAINFSTIYMHTFVMFIAKEVN